MPNKHAAAGSDLLVVRVATGLFTNLRATDADKLIRCIDCVNITRIRISRNAQCVTQSSMAQVRRVAEFQVPHGDESSGVDGGSAATTTCLRSGIVLWVLIVAQDSAVVLSNYLTKHSSHCPPFFRFFCFLSTESTGTMMFGSCKQHCRRIAVVRTTSSTE